MLYPPSQIYREKSGTPIVDQKYNEKMLEWREAARREAARSLKFNKEIERIPEYIKMLEGQHWDQRKDRVRREFYDNRLAKARIDSRAWLSDIRPTIEVSSKVEQYHAQADIAKNIMGYEWLRSALDVKLMHVVDFSLLGTGFWKIGASHPGTMSFIPCGPDCVIPLGPAVDIQESLGVMYRTYKPHSWFAKKWPRRSIGLEKESQTHDSMTTDPGGIMYIRPPHIDEITWNSLSNSMRSRAGVKVEPGSMGNHLYKPIELQEYWIDDASVNESISTVMVKDPYLSTNEHNFFYTVEPGQPLYPRKRLLVFGNARLMRDGPSPFWHGLYPFAKLCLNPVAWSPYGLSKYRDLIPINRAINEIVAGIISMIRKSLNPQMITKDGVIADNVLKQFFPDMPGGKLKLSPAGNVMTDVRYMDPPSLPPYVVDLVAKYLLPEFEQIAGFLDVNAIAGKKQIPGGDTLEMMRDSMQTATRLEGRYIEAFLRDSGIQAVSNIFQFYNTSQRIKILGKDGVTMEDFNYDPGTMTTDSGPKEDHWKMFSIIVTPGSALSSSKDRDKQMAIALFKGGIISRAELLRKLEWPEPDRVMAEADQERAMAAAQQQMAGGMMPDQGGGGRTPRMTRSARNGGEF